MRRVAPIIVIAVCLAACGGSSRTTPATTSQATHAIAIDPPAGAPSFLLRDQSGALIGPQRYRGSWTVVTFLYTHCPDVCPLIAGQLVAAQRQATHLRVIAVSVDPKGDTRAAVRSFLAARRAGPRFRYVTGTRAALAPVWRKYHIAALPGPEDTVSHNALSILIDPEGRERFLFDSHLTARDLTSSLAEGHRRM